MFCFRLHVFHYVKLKKLPYYTILYDNEYAQQTNIWIEIPRSRVIRNYSTCNATRLDSIQLDVSVN